MTDMTPVAPAKPKPRPRPQVMKLTEPAAAESPCSSSPPISSLRALTVLILRRRAAARPLEGWPCVIYGGLMVRDGACAPPHHEGLMSLTGVMDREFLDLFADFGPVTV